MMCEAVRLIEMRVLKRGVNGNKANRFVGCESDRSEVDHMNDNYDNNNGPNEACEALQPIAKTTLYGCTAKFSR